MPATSMNSFVRTCLQPTSSLLPASLIDTHYCALLCWHTFVCSLSLVTLYFSPRVSRAQILSTSSQKSGESGVRPARRHSSWSLYA